MTECPECGNTLKDLPSGQNMQYHTCEKCHCVWIFSSDGLPQRRMHDQEVLQRVDGIWYLRGLIHIPSKEGGKGLTLLKIESKENLDKEELD